MKNLIVYGDSFNATSEVLPGTHWSEILSKRHNLNLVSLARHGCSTRYVVFQMLHATGYPKDSIIIGSHSASFLRLEILTKDNKQDSNINMHSFENYDTNNKDISFVRSLNVSTMNDDDTIADSVKNVLLTKLPLGLNLHIDTWGMFYALHKLKESNSNFFYISQLLFKEGDLFDEDYLISVFGKEHIITGDEFSFNKFYSRDITDPGYHTHPESQVEIANIIEQRLKAQKLL